MSDFDLNRMMDRAEWVADANCRGLDPMIFYFNETTGNRGRQRKPDPIQLARAKAICRACDVQAECLAYALNNNEQGVWGGTSDEDRREMRRRQPMPRMAQTEPGDAA